MFSALFFWLHTPVEVVSTTNPGSHTGAGKAVNIAAPSLLSGSLVPLQASNAPGYFPVCSFYFERAS